MRTRQKDALAFLHGMLEALGIEHLSHAFIGTDKNNMHFREGFELGSAVTDLANAAHDYEVDLSDVNADIFQSDKDLLVAWRKLNALIGKKF